MAFSVLRYEAQKEREKKEEKQQSNQGNKGRVETPAPSQTTTKTSVLRQEAQKEREKKAAQQQTVQTNPTTALNELVANNEKRREELNAQLEEARQKELKARQQQLLVRHNDSPYKDKEKALELGAYIDAAADEYNAIKRELDQLDYIEKYKDKTFEDTFSGQFGANRTLGRLGQDTSEAYNEYLENPTDANRAYADALNLLTEHFQIQNEEALDDENAKLTWITQDLAQNIPQRWDQIKAGAAGGLAGGLAGLAAGPGGVVTGAKWGATAAVGAQSYNQMRGAAFQTLLNAGVDEETARAAASDEAVLSAMAEMADTAWTLGSLGISAVAKAVGKGGTKAVAKKAGSSILASALAKYGINIPQEILEEGFQQTVSIANLQRAQRGETGFWNLVKETGDVARDAFTGENTEARDEIVDAGWAGGKLAIMMGGVNYALDTAAEAGIRSHIGKKYASTGEETVQALIDSGLESAEGTESRKLAEKLQAKKREGKTISNAEVGALQQANVKAMEAERNAQPTEAIESAQETLERLAKETVKEQSKSAQSEDVGQETASQSSAIPYNAMSVENPVRKSVMRAKQDLKKWTGYGDAGQKAFESILENGNATAEEVRIQFQTSYELGRLGTPRKSVNLANDLQERAFTAGYQDYLVDQEKDKNKKFVVHQNPGFDRTGAPSDVTATQAEILDIMSKGMGVRGYFVGKSDDFNANIQGDATVQYATDFEREIRDADGNVVKTLTVVDHALHEMGAHRAMQVAPVATRAFVNKFYAYKMDGVPSTVGTLAEQKQHQYGKKNVALTTDKAFEEVIANEIVPTLYGSNEQEILRMVRRVFDGTAEEVKQAREGARTFRDVLNDMWKKLKDFAAKLRRKGDIAAAKEAEQAAASVKELRDMFEAILKEVAEKVKGIDSTAQQADNDGNNIQHSAKETKSPVYETVDTRKTIQATDFKADKARRVEAAKKYGLTDTEANRLTQYVGGYMCYVLNDRMLNNRLSEGEQGIATDIRNALLKLPRYSGTVYRNLKFKTETQYNAFLAEYAENNTVPIRAFTSTSKDPNGYPLFGSGVVHLVIECEGGCDISENFGLPRQQEVVLLPGSTLKVTSVTTANDGNPLIYAQEVMASENDAGNEGRDSGNQRSSGGVQSSGNEQGHPSGRGRADSQGVHGKAQGGRGRDGVLSERRKSAEPGDVLVGNPEESKRFSAKTAEAPVEQAISSAKTSIMQIPALFKDKNVVFGKTNIDIGGGRFDLAKNYLAERGTKSMIFDPYNRGAQENSETLAFLQSGKKADTATCANVLNVIAEPAARSNVILETAKAIKPGGTAYFMVYEGNGTGEGKQTSSGWQNNRKTADYVGEISEWFETVQRKGKLIIAKDPVKNLPKAAWEIQPGEAVMYSMKDQDYMKAVESGDMETAQKMVNAAAAAAMPESKIKTENGALRVVYHGTNTGDFNVFNPDYIGMSSGDDGFFGMGFYFAYSEGEAAYYGAKRIIPAYLNLKNPFNFDRELQTYNGKKARSGYAPDAVALMNFANKFPDIANSITIGVVEKGDDEVKDLPLREFAKAFKDVIDNKTFEHQELTNEYGEKETLVVADPKVHEYEYNGVKHSYRDYGFQKRFWGEANDLDVAYEYLSNTVYSYVDMLSRTRLILDNNREFTAALKEMGYDGAIQSEYGDEAVAFYPHQIKSADPVTYDDAGNVIPLSKRFNAENDDIRYSLKDTAGRKLTQEQADYFKNSKIRDKNGNLKVVYHGSGAKFTKFSYDFMSSHGSSEGQGFYFTDKKEMAQGYEQDGGQLLEGYLNITKPLSDSKVTIKKTELTKLLKAIDPTGDDVIINYDPSGGMGYPSKTWYNRALAGTVAQMMEYNESDSEILADIANSGAGSEMVLQKVRELLGYDGYIVEGKYDDAAVYVAFTSEQFKNADNLNPTSDPDIRYSLKNQDDLMRQNAKLKEVNQELQAQFKTTKFAKVEKNALRQFAKQLLKDYQSGADIDETRDTLDDVFTYIANGENGQTAVWEEAYRRAYDAAVSILSNSSMLDDEMFQAYKDLRNTLKNTGITISKEYDNDIAGYESINEFRKHNYGRIKLVNDGIPVDIFYEELATRYPEFFDSYSYSNQADQLSHIEEVLISLQPTEVNPYSHNMREAATWLANDIMERFFELPQAKPTFADKAQQKLTKQVIKDAEKLERVREQKNERIANLIEERREKVKEVTRKEKEKRDKKIREVKDRYKAKEAKMSESRKASVLRERILRHVVQMDKKLRRGTDTNNVPDVLKGAVADLLASINLESNYTFDPKTGSYKKNDSGLPTNRTNAFRAVKEQYAAIASRAAEYGMTIDPSLLGVPEEGIRSAIDQVIAMGDIRLVDMNYRQLETVYDVLRLVEYSVLKAGKMHTQSRWEHVHEVSSDFLKDTESRRTKHAMTKGHAMLDIETPYTFFSHFGKAGTDFFDVLLDAQDQAEVMQDEIAKRMAAIVSSEVRKKAEKETVSYKTQRGDELTLSKAHVMEIYLLSKRPQAKQHLLGGGIVQPEVGKVRGGTDAILLNEVDLGEIISTLTEQERKIADELQKLTLLLAEWGNKASLQVFGIRKFNDPNYWTIRSSNIGLNETLEGDRDNPRAIKNMGSAKAVTPEANNTLDISGVFDTFDRHASDMICYSAWLAPMEDATRLFNYRFRDADGNPTGKTIKKTVLNRAAGEGAEKYWKNLMADIQNGLSKPADNATEPVVMKVVGKVKKAAVSGNMRVVIQQPTAYARAAVVLSPDVMAAALAKSVAFAPAINGWKKAVKYAPIAARKAAGGYEIASNPKQLAEILYQPDTKSGKAAKVVRELPLKGAEVMDALTWGTIWNACELQVAKGDKSLVKGTDDFNNAVAKMFRDVIVQSQVVDGVLQRSQAMRSGSNFMKQMTSFTGEPTQGANMVIRAYDQLRYETNPQKRGQAIKKLSRAVSVYMFNAVLNAFAQSLVDGLRDDEEEKEYWEKVWAAFSGINGNEKTWWDFARNVLLASNVVNNVNPATWLPIWKDVLSLIQGYSVERMDAASMSDFIDSMGMTVKTLGGDGKYTTGYAILKMLTTGGKLLGSSSYNILRDVESVVRTFQVETDDFMARYETMKLMTKPENNKKAYADLLYRAYQTDKVKFSELYSQMIKDDELGSVNDDGEVTTTADYIAGALKSKLVDDLFKLYKSDQAAYKAMYNDLVRRDFLHTGVKNKDPGLDTFVSTEQAIAKAMENKMKKDQGVKKVSDLEQRYLAPAQQPAWDSSIKTIKSSGLWKSATEKQRDELEADLYDLVTGNTNGAKMRETIDAGKSYGVDDTEYLLWQLALDMNDKPSESGDMGSYNNAEKADAIVAMKSLGDSEKAYLWSTTTTSDEVLEALADGVDIDTYAMFKAGVSQMEAGVDYKKGDTASRKRAINKLLDEINASGSTRSWLYHTEYKK